MFERARRFGRGRSGPDDAGNGGGVATAEREETTAGRGGRAGNGNGARTADGDGNGTARGGAAATATRPHRGRRLAEDALVVDEAARLRQRDRFGGINWGAGFFGWLVALGLGAILTAIAAAAGTAIGLTNGTTSTHAAANSAKTIGLAGGIVLLVIGLVAYYAGGYVAGRMSRFDGARQGFAAWVVGLVITLLVAAAGAIFGSKYNVFSSLNLPRIPVDEGTLTTGGAIFLAAFVLGTLLASILGGIAGRRYHRRVDREALAGKAVV